jgi:peroxiredoxin
MNQLGGLAKDHTKYEEKGAQIIALAVQSQNEAGFAVMNTNAQYPILADTDRAVAIEYGVYDLFSDSSAAGSVFIIGQDGRIVWDYIAIAQRDRAPSRIILKNLPE